MLVTGLIATVAMYLRHYPLHTLLLILFAVLLVFYIIGLLVKKMFDTFGMEIEKRESAERENAQEGQQAALFDENQDGAVIEKQ